MSRAKYGPIDQLGLVVEDLDASIRRWSEFAGLGPWTVFRNVRLQADYRGQAGVVTIDVALAYQGDTQIELIEATNTTPSPYRDATGAPRAGLHHIAWVIDDLDVASAQALADGLRLVFRAESPGTRVAYFEADGEPGLLFEFIESAATRQLILDGRAAAKAWDGGDPVRVIDFAGL
jgi:methylmalonyl-CoA/ethylmalonyl-CoA epimerase